MLPPLLHATNRAARITLAPSAVFARRPFIQPMLIKAAIAIPQSSQDIGIPLKPRPDGEFPGNRNGTCVRRPVEIVRIEAICPGAPGVAKLGKNEQLALTGKPVQLSVTG